MVKSRKKLLGSLSEARSEQPFGLGAALLAERVKLQSAADLGAMIRTIRKQKKLTQQQLADLAGVGRRFIVECEAGKPRLEIEKALQVATVAGIDIIAVKR